MRAGQFSCLHIAIFFKEISNRVTYFSEWSLVRGAEKSTKAVKVLKGLHLAVSATLHVCRVAGDTGGGEVSASIPGQVLSCGLYAKHSFGPVSGVRGNA